MAMDVAFIETWLWLELDLWLCLPVALDTQKVYTIKRNLYG